ncbi:methionine ABC transporter permease [Anaeropeptidivorans aminofermentans]|jgi:D-methionine transport system permease protein|uniref:methionine ABC transporter permease n=1 Tax=Anaeropeptidivorans aminofermentans TaxID=2934315 RepID=UPI0020251181|nr:methionine ABC transporter permease [Anaeropeptidivorans aminofermentans]
MRNMSIAEICQILIGPALLSTLKMLLIASFLSAILGCILAILLIVTNKDGLRPRPHIYNILDTIVNIIRSFPFIILIVAIIPFTRFIAGTSIGIKGAVVPLTIAATPFMARVIEGSLKEVDKSLIEAAKSFGASDWQIIFKVMFVEAIPSIISGLCLAIVNLLGATAMAGAVGAGGLGAVAITYGYQSFNDQVMYLVVIVLIIMVQCIQLAGNYLYKKLK